MSAVIEVIAEMLREEGYRPKVDGEDLSFKVEGTTLWFETFGSDTGYARLLLRYALPEEMPFESAVSLANELTLQLKAVKTTVNTESSSVSFTIEQFFGNAEHLHPILERAIAAVRSASEQFFKTLHDGESNDTGRSVS